MRTGSNRAPGLRGQFSSIFVAGLLASGTGLSADVPGARPAPPVDPPAILAALGGAAAPVGRSAPADGAGPGLALDYGPLGLPCAARFEAQAAPGGTALLRLEMPCAPGATAVLTHGALAVSFRASSAGRVEAVFPAFAEEAQFTARLPDGATLSAMARVPGAGGYERVVTMWRGPEALSVHAFEYGAGEGEAGHVWRGAPRGAQAAEAGRGGFLLSLGAADVPDARRAEVYSFPAAQAARPGSVRIALAAAVTPTTCGGVLEAETLQLGEGLPGAPVALRIALPACGGAPGDLMLKNLARDLKIAAE